MKTVLSANTREAPLTEAPANMTPSIPPGQATGDRRRPLTGSAPPPPPRVDAEAIARLRELGEPGGPDLASEFIDLYVADGEALLEKIHTSCMTGESQLLKRQAHTLRGSSRNMGAETVAEIAREIENNAESADREQLAEWVRQLRQVFVATVPLLQAHKLPPAGP